MPTPSVRFVLAASVAAALLGASAAWVASRLAASPGELQATLTPPPAASSRPAVPLPLPGEARQPPGQPFPGQPSPGQPLPGEARPGQPPQAGAPPAALGPAPGEPAPHAPAAPAPSRFGAPAGPRPISPGAAALASDSPRSDCVAFQNADFGLTLTITAVGLAGPGLTVDAGDCTGSAALPATRICAPGITLDPGGDGCVTGVRPAVRDPGEYRGTVRLALTARCTGRALVPCDAPELADDPPSPGHPVEAAWADPGRAVCVRTGTSAVGAACG